LPHGIGVLHLVDGDVYRTFPPYQVDMGRGVDARY